MISDSSILNANYEKQLRYGRVQNGALNLSLIIKDIAIAKFLCFLSSFILDTMYIIQNNQELQKQQFNYN